jgi:hypothetical protein
MPDPGVTDPADLQALARDWLGLSWQLVQTRHVTPHPCHSGGGYDLWFCNEQLAKAQAGENVDVSTRSLSCWRERLHPYCQMGNKAREQVVGVDLLNLVTFLRAWPEATLEEMAIFIYNEGGPLYSKQMLSRHLTKLNISKKRASTGAYQAQREDVQYRVWSFWNKPSPTGIFQVPQCQLINVDEFCITIKKCNCTEGWALEFLCVRKDGHYHLGAKITVLFAIEPRDPRLHPLVRGSVQHPRHWVRCMHGVGTTINIFHNVCDHKCLEIEQFGVPVMDDHCIFLWDDLAAHHSAYIHQMVTGRASPRQLSIVAHPQYHPKFGTIEYKICELTNILRMEKELTWTKQEFENSIY